MFNVHCSMYDEKCCSFGINFCFFFRSVSKCLLSSNEKYYQGTHSDCFTYETRRNVAFMYILVLLPVLKTNSLKLYSFDIVPHKKCFSPFIQCMCSVFGVRCFVYFIRQCIDMNVSQFSTTFCCVFQFRLFATQLIIVHNNWRGRQ